MHTIYGFIFSRDYFTTSDMCRSWMSNVGVSPIKRVEKTDKTYKYMIRDPPENIKLRIKKRQRGVAFIYLTHT